MHRIHAPSPHRVVVTLALCAASLAGCKDKPQKDESAAREKAVIAKAKPLLGIYRITATTRNPKVCTAEGPALSSEGRDGYLVLVMGELMLHKALMAYSCGTVAECRKHAKKWEGGTFHFSFREIADGKLTGAEYFTGFSKGKRCERGGTSAITVVAQGPAVTITVRKTQVDYPADDKGHCDTRTARERTKGKPCNELTVIRAKKVADL